MYIYKISLTKAYYNLKYDIARLNYDVYKGAIIVAESRKECREIAFSELRGDETSVNLVNKRKPKNVFIITYCYYKIISFEWIFSCFLYYSRS